MIGFFTLLNIGKTFFSGAFDFILKHWKPLLIIGILAFLYFYRLHLLNQIEDLEERNVNLTENLAQCIENQAELQAGIDQQNNEIRRWADIGRDQDKKIAELEGKLTERKKSIDARVQQILQGAKPKNCEDAIKYLIDSVPELTWPKK